MPKIKIRKKFINKLKQLGVYDRWLEEVQTQWEMEWCWLNPTGEGFHHYHNKFDKNEVSFYDIINFSFNWADTKEGRDFWVNVARK